MKRILVPFYLLFLLPSHLGSHSRPPLLFSAETLDPKSFQGIGEVDPKRKESFPTFWGANALTQEDREVQGLKVTIFSLEGGAWIQHKKVKLGANRIEVYGKEAYKAFLKNGVHIEDQENGTVMRAGVGEYDKYSEMVYIKERPRLSFRDKTGKTTVISAKQIDRELNTKITKLHGGVIVNHPEVTIFCAEAVFKESEHLITTDPNPILISKNRYLSGKKLSFYTNESRILLEENTVLFQSSEETKKDPEGNEKKQTVLTILKGDKIESRPNEENDRTVLISGNATVLRKDMKITSDNIESVGKDSSIIRARKNIKVHDRENNLLLSGNVFDYFRKENYLHLTDEGKMEFLDKNSSQVTSTITAQEFERFLDQKETVIRGNIWIKSKSTEAQGEYATYFENDESVLLEGNPRINRSGKILRAGKIVFYPREGRSILTEGVHLGN
ncbi:LptA/OstA family protein [Leptospira licerasiae]|uniref:OstA-like protein n=1 Tax=Leptospira licerasiae str. MMD4847 TaxID=1049971 RepID=A0ABN0HD83_9LEPT|nr:LptA/OstA family protein [Leptospira licerasiae]EIE01756.1 OstA-like protein [Leptospira licerasiae serovar Varillal str. VAR 010]EJZ43509.1 OstA-like protein [Leptospira licerasiae str. MMD4847]